MTQKVLSKLNKRKRTLDFVFGLYILVFIIFTPVIVILSPLLFLLSKFQLLFQELQLNREVIKDMIIQYRTKTNKKK